MERNKKHLRKKVLIVDDEEYFLKACYRFLSRDYKTYLCKHGREAIDLIKTGIDFDTIFLDVFIPDVSGLEIFAIIKKHRPHLKKKVVFITAGILDRATQELLDNSGNSKLEKPFDLADLIVKIKE